MISNFRKQKNKATGFALIEVLVSMVVMAIALKGIGDYWNKTVKESEHNFSRSQALAIAQNLMEFVRVNPAGWDTYKDQKYWTSDNKVGANRDCFSTSTQYLQTCTPEQMALADIDLIKDYVQNHMPLMNGSIELRAPCRAGANAACVIVAWLDTTTAQCNPLNDGTVFFEDDANNNDVFDGQSQCVIIDFIPEHATSI